MSTKKSSTATIAKPAPVQKPTPKPTPIAKPKPAPVPAAAIDAPVEIIEEKEQVLTPGLAAQQIKDKAQNQLADLRQVLDQLRAHYSEAQEERQALMLAAAQRVDRLKMIREPLPGMIAKHQEAVAYALVAQETVGEQEALRQVRQCEWSLNNARSHVEQVERETIELDAAATARLATIDADLKQWSQGIEATGKQVQEVERVAMTAHVQLGDATYAHEMLNVYTLDERIEQVKKELMNLQYERISMLEASATVLTAWPDHVQQVRQLLPYDDAVTRCLDTARAHVRQILIDGLALQSSMAILPLLCIERTNMFVYNHVGTPGANTYWQARLFELDRQLAQWKQGKR